LYEIASEAEPREAKTESDLLFRLLEASELDRTVSFQQACLGGVEELAGWLLGYSTNLIERRALLVLSRDEQWLGLGECRKSDSQEGVVDVGVMVAPAHRGQGWATDILLRLRVRSAICSTTVENVAAQRAITRTGFASRHRIMNVSLASG
jgi:GNAT superfamily N-acetyltransferase